MTVDQGFTLLVLAATVAALIWGRVRADIVALSGAAILLVTGVLRPVEVQGAFASPAIIALASLFVIVYALELSGFLDRLIELGVRLCERRGKAGIWLLLSMIGGIACFINSTPIIVLGGPVIRDVAIAMKESPKRYLIPLSYITILAGCCTLIGTSTNLLVDDMASVSGQPRFGMFEITPVGLSIGCVGAIYLFFASGRLGAGEGGTEDDGGGVVPPADYIASAQVGDARVFTRKYPLRPWKAVVALGVFVGAIALAALNVAPIAATAFGGAVLLILLKVISPDEAYHGLKPEILILIAGMVVIGIALEVTGLAGLASEFLIGNVKGVNPLLALSFFYVATIVLTEILSNATVAVLVTPIAVALAESLGVSPRPFLVATMMAASAAFATPFGYQVNTIVYQMGNYRYMDFVRIGLPLNIITATVGVAAIHFFFPF